jgi:hypothetical protein
MIIASRVGSAFGRTNHLVIDRFLFPLLFECLPGNVYQWRQSSAENDLTNHE